MPKNELRSQDLKLSGKKEKLIEWSNGHDALRLQCQTGAVQDRTILTDEQRVFIEKHRQDALKREHATMLTSQSSPIAMATMISPTTPLPSDSGYK